MAAWARKLAPELVVLLLLLGLVLTTRTVQADPPPVYREADSCAELAPPGVTWYEFRIGEVASGSYANGYLTVTLTVYQTGNRTDIDWQANRLIDAVYVAGGPGGNLYLYIPPATSGTGLHAPLNPSGKNYHSPQMLLLCSTMELEPTATPPPPATATATATGTVTATATATTMATATATLTPTVTMEPPPAGFRIFLALAMKGPGAEEPNNVCGEASPIAVNQPYRFLADDEHDWFTFVLAEAGEITVRLRDFAPERGQVAAYRGESCGSSITLGNYGLPGPTKTLALGTQPAGRYFVYVSNDGVMNGAEPYELVVEVVWP